jgi:transcriptional regulator with XRE-family HTH domain
MEPIEDLKLELQDPEFARFYGADQAQVQLALTLVAARSKLGLTQKEIADKLGTSQPYIAKLEKGDANPTVGKIGSMLALLELRLVTQTVPLLPESTLLPIESVGAADVGTNLQMTVDVPYTAVEPMNDWLPTRRVS